MTHLTLLYHSSIFYQDKNTHVTIIQFNVYAALFTVIMHYTYVMPGQNLAVNGFEH